MANLNDALAKVSDCIVGVGRNIDQVVEAERALSVKFAADYIEYLLQFGVLCFDGHELTSVSNNKRVDVVTVTIEERTQFPDVPSTWYVIEQANIDGIVIWQDSTGKVYLTSPGSEPKQIYNSLAEYIQGE